MGYLYLFVWSVPVAFFFGLVFGGLGRGLSRDDIRQFLRLGWVRLLGLLLITSLAVNIWAGVQLYHNNFLVRQGTADLVWGANNSLGSFAQSVNDPRADWGKPTFRSYLMLTLDRSAVYAESASSVMGVFNTGPRGEVINHLNLLDSQIRGYEAMVTSDPVPADARAKLQQFAKRIQAAGLPMDVHRDSDADWTRLAGALKQLLQAEGMLP